MGESGKPQKYTLIYQDIRKIRFVKDFRTGMANVVLSKKGQELTVNETQKDYLLKLKNGTMPIFKLKGDKSVAVKDEKGGDDNAIGV